MRFHLVLAHARGMFGQRKRKQVAAYRVGEAYSMDSFIAQCFRPFYGSSYSFTHCRGIFTNAWQRGSMISANLPNTSMTDGF